LTAWSVLLALLALSACTALPPKPVPPVAGPPTVPAATPAAAAPPAPAPAAAEAPPTHEQRARETTQALLVFHERSRLLSPAELAREITRLEAQLQIGGVPAAAPVSAAAASASASAVQAPPQAAPESALAEAQAQRRLELALLLAQQRQNGDLARALAVLEGLQHGQAPVATQPLARLLHTRLSEQRRLEDQLERQGQTLRELQRRADQLAAQLEALRAIERSLNTRPPAQANPR
jgi:hypothetical protein